MQPKISVIVPCYNVSKYVGNCIDHLINQTIGVENLEIILVDDASTDGGATLAVLMEYEKRYPEQIMVIPLEENLRQGGARNVGMYYASGEYIAFCDSDDWFAEEAFEHLYRVARAQDCDIVEFENYLVDSEAEDHYPIRREDAPCDQLLTIDTEEMRKEYLVYQNISVSAPNKIYRTSLLKDHGICFPEHVVMEEVPVTYLMRFFVKKHYFLFEKLYYYHVRENSTMTGAYEAHKFDLLKVHEFLLNECHRLNVWEAYPEENQYTFWKGYFYDTIMYAVKNQTFFTNEQWVSIQKRAREEVPDIGKNRYFLRDFPQEQILADLTYCDGANVDMQALYEGLRAMRQALYYE